MLALSSIIALYAIYVGLYHHYIIGFFCKCSYILLRIVKYPKNIFCRSAKVHTMNFYGLSDKAILREIGRRLKRKRLDQNLTQQSLAEIAGLNRSTISEAENGVSVSTQTLIQILRGLHVLDQIDAFLPDPGLSPLQLAKLKGKERQRASGSVPRSEQETSDW